MSKDRFVVDLQSGKNAEETVARLMEQVIRLTAQLNRANIPVVIGPLDSLPVDPKVGHCRKL